MSKSTVGAFSADERAVIDFWFEHPEESPQEDTPAGAFLASVGLPPGEVSIYSTCAAYVAQIALAAVEERLPQWASVTETTITLGRDVRPTSQRFNRTVQLQPRHLFEINWANSGPGFSWPCDYYATWLPGYGRWVVTISVDSTDIYNVCDVAIGWFPDTEDFHTGVHDIVVREWRGPPDSEIYAWEHFWTPGVVDEATACAWREEVWPDVDD
jgi:hypothetical protein